MEKRLPGLVVNSYGLANFSLSLMLNIGTMYYSIFLTDVALISPIHISLIIGIGGAIDTLSIFASGSIIQKTQMRWGQFRSWFLFIPLTTCIFFTLSFANLPLSYNLKIVYLTLAYIIGHVSLNFAFNSHIGFISVLTKDIQERLRLSVRNIQFGMASTIVFSQVIVRLLEHLKIVQDATWAYFYTVALLSAIQIFGYWNLFYQTREYEKYDPSKKLELTNKITIWEMVKQVLVNRQLLLLMSADVMAQLGLFSIMGMAIYFLKYIANNEPWMANHTLATGILSFITALYAPVVIKFLGKKKTYLIATAWGAMSYLLLRGYGTLSVYHFTGFICLGSLLLGTAGPMRQAMYMDAAEYGYYKSGKDASAFIMSMFTVPIKIAIALQGVVVGFGLEIIGYVPNTDMTPEMAGNLMDIICYIPAGCGVIAMLLMTFYRLTDKNMAEIMAANSQKRAVANA